LEIKDLAGLSEPFQKLVQVVADGIGAVAYPWIVRREAKAIADAQKILTEGGLTLESAAMKSLPAQIAARVDFQEAKRQKNLGQVVDAACKELPENVSGEPVDPDWVSRFFSVAQEVSNEQMQQIWGRLLAGEVAQPGSFSLRAIERLRNMTSSEAKLFSELCEFAFTSAWDQGFILFVDPSIPEIPKFDRYPDERPSFDFSDGRKVMSIYKTRGLGESSFHLLSELGLINIVMGDGVRFSGKGKSPFRLVLRNGNRDLIVEHDDPKMVVELPIARLTSVGRELLRLHIPGVTPEFDAMLNEVFGNAGFRVRWQPIPPETGPTSQ
jgi:hypothetical protein